MAHSRQTIAAFRYGYGFGPGDQPDDVQGLMDQLKQRRERPPITKPMSTADRLALMQDYTINSRRRNQRKEGGVERFRANKSALSLTRIEDDKRILIRAAYSRQGFRERLSNFWTDHFTAEASGTFLALFVPDMIETAIRPHLAGSFADMLQAVAMHPAMIEYLNQNKSIGPNSPAGQRWRKGLNENLAREILELHTLGVGADYTQNDVGQLAELLTGLSYDKDGFYFRDEAAEPGAEQVLGKIYGGAEADLETIKEFLNDLAQRPETAAHLARKLAVHFVSPNPDAELVNTIKTAFIASKGNLSAVYEAMLGHPAAWVDLGAKVRQPFEFVAASLKAVGVSGNTVAGLDNRKFGKEILLPLQQMGQITLRPGGPDGWSEDAEDWITPPLLSARIIWASKLAVRYEGELDIDTFVQSTLGDMATTNLQTAVSRADSRSEAVALVLASPEFNRR